MCEHHREEREGEGGPSVQTHSKECLYIHVDEFDKYLSICRSFRGLCIQYMKKITNEVFFHPDDEGVKKKERRKHGTPRRSSRHLPVSLSLSCFSLSHISVIKKRRKGTRRKRKKNTKKTHTDNK